MNNKKISRATPVNQPFPHRLRRTSLLILGLGVSAFAPAAWAAPCDAANTAACSAPGGTHPVNPRGGDGGAGNGQGGNSSVLNGSSVLVNAPGAPSLLGNGGDGADGVGPNAGTGGAGGPVGGPLGNTGNTGLPSFVSFGGGGGGGGTAIYNTSAGLSIVTFVQGGQGGAGGDGNGGSAVAGGGGGGGAGVIAAGVTTSVINGASIVGGRGGAGGNASGAGSSDGGGGGGGDGVLLIGTGSTTFDNQAGATVTGGVGGLAGTGGDFGATAGASGAGVNLAAPNQVLINDGTISGGAGTTTGTGGAAGAAIISYGNSNQITNSGILSGGLQADLTPALAIDIEANDNLVSLEPTSIITGDLLSNGSGNGLNLLAGTGTLASNVTGFTIISAQLGADWNLSGTQTLTRDLTINTVSSGNLLISGAITGAGGLTLVGNGVTTLSGVNSYTGVTQLQNAGTLALSGTGALGPGGLNITNNGIFDISQSSAATVIVSTLHDNGGDTISLGNRNLTLGAGNSVSEVNGVIADFGIVNVTGGSVTIAPGPTGSVTLKAINTYTGGTTVSSGTLALAGPGTLGRGALDMDANTTLDISQSTTGVSLTSLSNNDPGATIKLGSNNLTLNAMLSISSFDGVIADGGINNATGGSVTVRGSVDLLQLQGANTYTGGTTLDDGAVVLIGDGSLAANGAVTLTGTGSAVFDISGINAAGTSIGNLSGTSGTVGLGGKTLTINGVNDSVFDGVITGANGGIVKQGVGALVLNGANNYTGSTSLLGGSLFIGNAPGVASITSNVTTAGGTTLGGYGQIVGSVDIASLGHLVPGGPSGMGTLTVGDLTLNPDSQLDFELGTASGSAAPGVSDHIVSTGNVTLRHAVLNITDAGGLGPGLYNLISYSGFRVNNFLTLGSVPPGGFSLQFLDAQKQINLISTAGATLNFWNANGLASGSQMGGGDGTWSTTAANWTDSTGSFMGPMQPQPGFAIFGGAAGTVTVDNTAGAVVADGIQFASDGYVLNGDTLTLVADTGHPAPVEVRVGDGSAASMDWTATINNVIAGISGLNKTGAGTLVLTGANTYTGGTSISAGALSVDSDTELGDASNSLALNGGTLRVTGTTFNQTARAITLGVNGGGFDIADAANTFTLNQALSGNGGLNKLGAGTLLVTADNSYTGGTTISGGTLQLGNGGTAGSITGNVVNNGTLVFNRADSVVFGGAMSGAGNMLQAGPGLLTLTGDSGAFTGASNVAAGILEVDGKLGGSVSVAGGATLTGVGAVGSTTLASGSILAPGNASSPIGTLTVNGNLSFASGTTYQVQVDPAGTTSDLVHVTGTAALAGSVVHIGPGGNFAPSQTYTILTADGGVTGAFDSVASNFAFLAPTITYDPNDAFLTLKRNSTSFSSLAQTGNQRAVAGALDSMTASAALPTAVSTVSAAQAPGTFDALSGEIHPSTTSVLQSIAQNTASMPLEHLRTSLSAGSVNGPATAQLGSSDASSLPGSAAQPVWAQVFGNWRTLSGNGDAGQVRESDGGLFVGADRAVGAGWRLGGALGYTGSHSSLNDRNSTANVDSYTASIYGGKAFQAGPGKINLMLGTAYTWNDIHTKRDVGVAGLDQTLKANYGASTGQVFGELGYALPLNENFTLEPFAGVAYSDVRTRGFSESGASGSSGDSAALDGKSNSNDVTTSTLGLHARTAFTLKETQGHLNATVGWRHAFGDVKPETTMAFDGSQTFTVAGAPLARDAAVLQLGVDVAVTKNTTVGVAYSGQYGAGNQQNSGNVNVSWRF
jgi:fibronectin-binding autotransporter adhesin